MKNLYLLMLVLAGITLNAQIVNIPDANFKAFLLSATPNNHIAQDGVLNNWVTIDTNNDGEIQISEALVIKHLSSYNPSLATGMIQSIEGIKSFSNLKHLDFEHFHSLTSVDLSNMQHLTYVNLGQNQSLTSANFANLSSIATIHIQNSGIIHLDVSNLPTLVSLDCSRNNNNTGIETINYSGSTNIKNLNCASNNIYSIDLSSLVNLKSLTIFGNELTALNLSNLVNLEGVTCSSNHLTSVNLTNTPMLKSLEASYNNLTSLDLTNKPLLNYLRAQNNSFTNIDLSQNPLLATLNLMNNNLTSLDISHNPLLGHIMVGNNNLSHLNIKNGKINNANWASNPSLQYICCDENETQLVLNFNANNSISNAVINTYCSFAPGGTYYTIQGNTKYDIDGNGCDANDPGKAFQKFTISNGTASGAIVANTSGNYTIPVSAGTNILTPVLENPSYFNISPASLTVTFPMQTSPLNQNFCVGANGVHNDLEVTIFPITNAAPGFNAKYKIIYKNKGTTTQSGSVSFNYNDNISDFVTSSVAPSSQSSGLLNFNFIDLLPFETKEILVTIHLNTPTQTPPLNAGDILHYTSQITGLTDETPSDNTFIFNQTVVNSFDPNDKTCLQGTSIAQSQIGDYVHYLIRFENTGTANAQNVVVKDVIDTNKFDISTLVALNASHGFVTRIINLNTVEFIFENIQLPFDDANNDGYILFKIKTKSTLTAGDSFSNSAGIYFDYNAPIITNTYTTSVTESLSTIETAKDETIAVYPNPVQDIVNFRSKEKVLKLEVYDISGRIVSSLPVINQQADLSSLRKGNFMVKIILKDKFYTKKIIKK